MALATTCPQCKTSFKVVPDQLKLRRGLVRCGVCQHVFSGIDYLRYVDDAARAAQRQARAAATSASPPTGTATDAGAGPARAAVPDPRQPTPAGADASGHPARDRPPLPGSIVQQPSENRHDRPPADALPGEESSGVTAPGIAAPAGMPSVGTPGAAAPPGVPPRSAGPHPVVPDGAPAEPVAPVIVAGHPAPAPTTSEPVASTPPGSTRSAQAAAEPVGSQGSTDQENARPGASNDIAPPVAPTVPSATPWPVVPAVSPTTVPEALRSASPAAPTPWQADVPLRSTSLRPPQAGPSPLGRSPSDRPVGQPTLPWPDTAVGPQTVIDSGDDLKTAFFLTDSAFGPLPADAEESLPPPVSRRPAARFDPRRPDALRPPPPEPAASEAPLTVALPLRPEAHPHDGFLTDPAPASPLAPEHEPTTVEAGDPDRSPLRDAGPLAPEPAESVIDYFAPQRSRSRSLGLALSPVAWAGAALLAWLLTAQALVGWRDAIAARAPWFGPVLAAVVSPLGLTVGPPREIDALTIESFELQSTATPNLLQLRAVLRNRSTHVVAFPAMELTLTDSIGEVLVRKVILAQTYVTDPATASGGLAARSEWPLRLALEHGGLQPTGYSVALFYP